MSTEPLATVLTIDDEEIVRRTVAICLKDRGYSVWEAPNGLAGLDIIRRMRPDVVLVDLRMPEMDGLDVVETIGRESPDLPAIVVSGTGVIADAVEALHRGAWDFVTKPIEDMEVLYHAVAKALERSRLIRENRAHQMYLEEKIRQRTTELLASNESLSNEIEERKKAEGRLRFQGAVLDQIGDQIIATDLNGCISYVNHAAVRMLGTAGHQLVGDRFERHWGECERGVTARDIIERTVSDGAWSGKVIRRAPDESALVLDARCWVLRDEAGRPTGVCSVSTDVTERERARAEREQLITKLEGKNAELERFTYTASHDLKSPLITIKGFVGRLEADIGAGDVEGAARDMAYINGATDKIYRLLDELLRLARVGYSAKPSENIALSDLAREALELAEGGMRPDRTTVDIAPNLPVVRGDRVRLLEVFQNLLDNAIKFTRDEPHAHIEVGVRRDGDQPVYFVSDNGVGIDERHAKQVFDLFNRIDTSKEGTGVGLTVAKRVVEVHGGRIWVEPMESGHGSRFCFTLPGKEPALDDATRRSPRDCADAIAH